MRLIYSCTNGLYMYHIICWTYMWISMRIYQYTKKRVHILCSKIVSNLHRWYANIYRIISVYLTTFAVYLYICNLCPQRQIKILLLLLIVIVLFTHDEHL